MSRYEQITPASSHGAKTQKIDLLFCAGSRHPVVRQYIWMVLIAILYLLVLKLVFHRVS